MSFTDTNLLKMADRNELRENALAEYGSHFDIWLDDLKKTHTYICLVDGYEENWVEIYKQLNRIFKETVWCQRKLKNEDEEDDPWLRITKTQLDNYILCKYFNYLSSAD